MALALALAGCAVGPTADVDTDRDAFAPTERILAVTTSGCGHANDGSGVGVAIDRNLALTAAHVVAGARSVTVLAGRPGTAAGEMEAHIVALDHDADLALLRLDANLDVGPAAEAGIAEVGLTGTIGLPEGHRLDYTVREVTVFETDRVRQPGRTRRHGYVLDADVKPGHSGAGLFDEHGRLVGIVFAMSADQANRTLAVSGREIEELLADHGRTGDGEFECSSDRSLQVPVDD